MAGWTGLEPLTSGFLLSLFNGSLTVTDAGVISSWNIAPSSLLKW